jgi:hypothetical protein
LPFHSSSQWKLPIRRRLWSKATPIYKDENLALSSHHAIRGKLLSTLLKNTFQKQRKKGRRRRSKPTRDHRSGSKQLAYKVEEGMFQNLERKQAMQKISSQVPKTDKQTAKYP